MNTKSLEHVGVVIAIVAGVGSAMTLLRQDLSPVYKKIEKVEEKVDHHYRDIMNHLLKKEEK